MGKAAESRDPPLGSASHSLPSPVSRSGQFSGFFTAQTSCAHFPKGDSWFPWFKTWTCGCPPHLSSPLHLCPKPLPLSPIANASQCGRPLILVPGTGRSRLSVTLETPLQNPSTPFNNLLEWCLCVCREDSACLLHRHYRILYLHRPILQMRKWRLRALMWLPEASELEFRYLPLPQYTESIPKWAKPSALEGLIPNIWISSSAGRTPEQLISIAAW